ncbi:MAG: arginine--tRNA ligase [bacterium]|nr:arginine--tRNA ligase [bacterium]
MKDALAGLISRHLKKINIEPPEQIQVEIPKVKDHGDFSTNVAMVLAKSVKQAPRELAQELLDSLERESDWIKKIELKGPGFINFFLKNSAYQHALTGIWENGKIKLPCMGKGKKILVEFVSANPTGPMHVGHGRNAVVGDSLARLLGAVGYEVTREFYVNDHGVQIKTLGHSGSHYHTVLRQVGDVEVALPDDMYRGEYLEKLVDKLHDQIGKIKKDPLKIGKMLGEEILHIIREDLDALEVRFDHYFSESSLYESGEIDAALEQLKKTGNTYEQEEALWFRSSEFGDDKDRVLIKSDNTYTYFTPDIAYHKDKFDRTFDLYINVMGADHGGYVKRMKAAVQAMGYNPQQLEFVLMQMVSLVRGGEKVAMSKRSGEYITLREVVDEVGKDAARFFFMLRSHNTHLDFDLELAKEQSSENPVFYVQYAHARMASIFRKAAEAGHAAPDAQAAIDLNPLQLPEEVDLIKKLLEYPDVLVSAAQGREPHRVAFYLLELAKIFQNYYTKGKTDSRYRVIQEEANTTQAKLYLILSLQAIFRMGLEILGVSAPEEM